ncbi:PP2C family protein-serine/threonine phosphatase [Nocardia brasiliensis]|uniref:PP2C family protein-serine/threonine phosphatase n=1 Tax=Nocardia brasiliensis TaxID=37326 RepID=UPI002455864F|nr:PP2C family protein-serine/threonine phosphatase [Nocardia brasiliensis]
MRDDSTGDRAASLAEQRRSLVLALKGAELTVEELWTRYFAMTGDAGFLEVDAYVHGLGELATLDRDILAQAVNERLDELTWANRARYSRPFRDPRSRYAPLSALTQLLEGTRLAPPERLAAIAAAAGRALGVGITIYLVDYAQRRLRAVPVETADVPTPPEVFDVDTTLPGRAFRTVRILPAHGPHRPRLWVPLLDGTERLGVLDVEVSEPDDLYDPGLRAHCRWVSDLLGHLVTAVNHYGDGLDRVRLHRPRTTSAELMWSLLPPLTAGVDSFVVAGVLEPGHNLNGDAFDYGLTENTAHLLVLDAVGHDLHSGLIAATALAAYRGARHAGHGLYEQARTIDETIHDHFGQSLFATAVLIELDLNSGRLRYINAGHPEPLIMRDGKVVKPLSGGRRLPLGLGGSELTVGEEILQPQDWLVLYTDGVIEARDDDNNFFGEARLIDFLRREASTGHPPPETARRLIHAILTHQHGNLQDDATVLLARWTHPARLSP